MQGVLAKQSVRRGSIVYLRTDSILPNPVQPRKLFDGEAIEELSSSIRNCGIINPLTVRYRSGDYELVAGERRLRAAKLAGLAEVPCVVLDVSMEDASLLALVENLQRKDLDYIEEAEGINRLIRMFGMSQEEAARRIGKSQSAVANKLRLLKLPRSILDSLRANALTERHGRALLRLSSEAEQEAALAHIIENSLTVSETDAYIEKLLTEKPKPKPPQKKTFVMKDVRVFLNTVSRSLDMMRKGGISAGMKREETEDELVLTISIPKQPQT